MVRGVEVSGRHSSCPVMGFAFAIAMPSPFIHASCGLAVWIRKQGIVNGRTEGRSERSSDTDGSEKKKKMDKDFGGLEYIVGHCPSRLRLAADSRPTSQHTRPYV